MKTIDYFYDSTVVILAQAATVKSTRVQWDSSTYVDFNHSGKLVNIKSVHTGIAEFETIFFSDNFKSLSPKAQQFVAAAVLALNTNAAKVGDSLVILIPNADSVRYVQVAVASVQKKQEALTDQPYAISGHRIEPPRPTVTVETPTIKVKGGWGIALAVAAGLAVVGIAAAASRN